MKSMFTRWGSFSRYVLLMVFAMVLFGCGNSNGVSSPTPQPELDATLVGMQDTSTTMTIQMALTYVGPADAITGNIEYSITTKDGKHTVSVDDVTLQRGILEPVVVTISTGSHIGEDNGILSLSLIFTDGSTNREYVVDIR